MSNARRWRRLISHADGSPRRTLVITGEVSESMTESEREGAVRRRLVATTGRCPCGAVLTVPAQIESGAVTIVAVEHEPDCPAIEETP